MEKRKPHYSLSLAQSRIAEGRFRVTQVARAGAADMGFDEAGLLGVVTALDRGAFYKSMTSHADHTVWQDVYRPMTQRGQVYIKLTLQDDLLIVSFKER